MKDILTTDRIAVCCVGLGRHMLRSLLPNIFASADFEVVAGVDPDPQARALLAERLPSATLYADIGTALAEGRFDLVVVASDPDVHYSVSSAALAAGKHVFVEKPPALDSHGCAALIDQARQAQSTLFVGTMWRYGRARSILDTWVAERDLRVERMDIQAFFPEVLVRPGWEDSRLTTAFTDMFIHPIDYAVSYLGDAEVSRQDMQQVDNRVHAQIVLAAPGGLRADLSLSSGSSLYGSRITTYYSDGTVAQLGDLSQLEVFPPDTWSGTPGTLRDRPGLSWEQGPLYRGYGRIGYAEEFEALAQVMRGTHLKPTVGPVSVTMSILETCLEAAG
ncbi:Gfo/Idh/MocA family protein [Marivita sp. S0852]|uniref:Gfo/Idh/MocA family protein n=1 Tax=Marivita sp. S0852 TaxID=3373893 RepID=UPI003981CCED